MPPRLITLLCYTPSACLPLPALSNTARPAALAPPWASPAPQVLELPQAAAVAAMEASADAAAGFLRPQQPPQPPLDDIHGFRGLGSGAAAAEPREVASVYTIRPIHQLACFEDLLVVTNGRAIDFYRLGGA